MSLSAQEQHEPAHRAHKPRVLHLLKGLGPGGAERLVLNQLLTAEGEFDYAVLRVIAHKDHLVAEIEQAGAETGVVGGGRMWPLKLAGAIAAFDPDIVHAHSPVLAAAARTLSRLGRIDAAVVTTEHNRWPRHHRATRLANRLTAPFDDARFAVSEDVRNTMDRRLRSSTVTLDHGVPIEQLQTLREHRASYRDALGATADSVVIGIVANFRPEKAYDVFLDAATRAVGTSPKVHFVVIGQGPGEAEFHQAVQASNVASHISVLGYRSDAAAVMTAFDIFTLTSRHEGKPVSVMEAMALGLPIVATRAGGIPEAVENGKNGLLADVGDAATLASHYVALAEDQERRASMGASSLAMSITFDASRATRSIESAYHGVLSTND